MLPSICITKWKSFDYLILERSKSRSSKTASFVNICFPNKQQHSTNKWMTNISDYAHYFIQFLLSLQSDELLSFVFNFHLASLCLVNSMSICELCPSIYIFSKVCSVHQLRQYLTLGSKANSSSTSLLSI